MKHIIFSRIDKAKFFRTLNKRVNSYFKENNIKRTGNWKLYTKAVIMFSLYLVPFILLLTMAMPNWLQLILTAIIGVGMAGVGKTTVGRVLSKKIHRKFLDLDQEFEEQTKIRITEFFAIYGEKEFRKIERRIINDVLTKNNNLVVSAGGGIFSNNEIRDQIIEKSNTFFLNSSVETLAERLKKNFSNRPLLNKGNLRENIEKLYDKRIKNYMMAKHIILVDNLSIEDVVLNIIKKI